MKLKDIEKGLKSEQNSQQVPDVLQRAKKAPINRLLDGQTPLKAFDKQTAVRLLWCAMLLLVTAVFAIGAIALIPKGEREQVELCYVNIRIESEGEITTYGMVVEDCETVAVFVLEKQNTEVVARDMQKKGEYIENAINDVYQAKSGDKVSICVLCDNDAGVLSTLVTSVFEGKGIDVKSTADTSQARADLKAFVGNADANDIDTLIDEYLAKF